MLFFFTPTTIIMMIILRGFFTDVMASLIAHSTIIPSLPMLLKIFDLSIVAVPGAIFENWNNDEEEKRPCGKKNKLDGF